MRKHAEFERIQRGGARVNTDHFVLILAAQSDAQSATRLGITASRKIGGAVERNRAKRLVRAAFRETSELFVRGVDLVVIVRRPLGDAHLADVVAEWRGASAAVRRRIEGLLAPPPEGGKTPA